MEVTWKTYGQFMGFFWFCEENDSAKATRFETCRAKLNSNDTRGTHAQYTRSLWRHVDNLQHYSNWVEDRLRQATNRFETCSAKLNSNDARGTLAQYTGSLWRHVDNLQHYSNWAGNRLRLHAFNSNWPVLLPGPLPGFKKHWSVKLLKCWQTATDLA